MFCQPIPNLIFKVRSSQFFFKVLIIDCNSYIFTPQNPCNTINNEMSLASRCVLVTIIKRILFFINGGRGWGVLYSFILCTTSLYDMKYQKLLKSL